MKKFSKILTPAVIGTFILASCSTSQMASRGETDNLYFMASDAKLVSQYAVQNNRPETFQEFDALSNVPDESFSSRNVNPDYLSRYQSESVETGDEVVYFDEFEGQQNSGNIDAYNNYRVGGANTSPFSNPSINFNMGLMYGFNPWGFGFFDPFWGPGWGFRPGFNVNLGFGWGNPFYGPFGRPFGMGFYDPFWGPGFGPRFGGWGFPGYAWGGYPGWGIPVYAGNPIYVLPGSEFSNRGVVRGARPTRGAGLAGAGFDRASSAALPSTARAEARRNVLNQNRGLVGSDRARSTSRDFSSSQNDYYNSGRSRVSTSRVGARSASSPALDRSSSIRTRSAMPSARPTMRSYGNTNSRSSMDNYRRPSSSPSYGRSSSPSYNRSAVPSRSASPSYNRGSSGTNSRSVYTPSRGSSGGSVSVPSRSSSGGGGMSSGGSRGGGGGSSSSSGSRGGRGN
ncbi:MULTISPECIES: hypothetical protein [unclassified Algoriphagus]|jgi:hypothetical protein|uniref:hypothetical protein n=1 Tax=unclassified Algoriphagus TaxID=2641541 RepID=UPI0021039F83|nr:MULTISPECIES: hypothetical protein [unclassified Algoriphagus]|tara:strand:- start:8234 stop:9595 length:1362 start_codon:yes stop_codon:yes gene_type:complete